MPLELIAAAVGVVEVTARSSSKAWKLCAKWKDAPREVYSLRDDLDRAGTFFSLVRHGLDNNFSDPNDPSRVKLVEELHALIKKGQAVLTNLEAVIDTVLEARPGGKGEIDEQNETELRKKYRLMWLRRYNTAKTLKASLYHIMDQTKMYLTLMSV